MVHQSAWDRLQQIENVEVDSLISQKTKISQRSQAFRKSSTSVASYKENLVEMQAKKAALQGKLKFAVNIAEQQQKLEQLKIEQELEAINAQEAIYQKAIAEEVNVATNYFNPHLPNHTHGNLDTHDDNIKDTTEKNGVTPSCMGIVQNMDWTHGLDPKLDPKLDSKLDPKLDPKLDSKLDSKF